MGHLLTMYRFTQKCPLDLELVQLLPNDEPLRSLHIFSQYSEYPAVPSLWRHIGVTK